MPDINPKSLIGIRLKLASPDKIRSWSHGEVKRAETINYRTQKPERDGLFCERIFGPVRDYECACGKYKGKRYKGIICDRCGVEVTSSSVRRERMGHIELAVPVAHIWYYKVPPSVIGLLLDLTVRQLEDILYYDAYIVTDPGDVPEIRKGMVLTETQYRALREEYGDEFHAEMGAPPIKRLLAELDLEELSVELRTRMKIERSLLRKTKILKKLKVVEAFLNSGNRPEWMILEVIPVIPPDLRPLVPLEGGRYATSDLNDLYRRVITRNNRLKHMLEMSAPEIILRNEKRMLQEAVDALLDNSRRRRPVTGKGGRKLKSLSDILRGKKGLLRRNLLGKRVDYSGRSVIVVGPELKLHQVGLPKEMAIELFRPFVEHKLEETGIADTIRAARRMLQRRDERIWGLLEEIVKDHPVMLNRQPTLHRPSIQAFEPVLVEGKSIKLHPLVCPAYNADFDGDQMAVYVPISPEALAENMMLLLSPYNILSPAHGRPLAAPTRDMVIGLHYLTKVRPGAKGEGKLFSSIDEVRLAYEHRYIDLHALIKVPIDGKIIETTYGRIIFNEILPEELRKELGFVNEEQNKKTLAALVGKAHKLLGSIKTAEFLDRLKDCGFLYATLSGLTFGIEDMVVPPEKKAIIDEAMRKRDDVEEAYRKGLISRIERYQKILDIWTEATERVKDAMLKRMKEDRHGFNPIWMSVYSGARGNEDQVRQISGMRGLMARPAKAKDVVGEFIETPIISNFKEGLNVLEYFISTHGARKGLSDTALKTANAGHLTRRLVDVAQEVVVTMEDCGTVMGRRMTALKEGETIIEPLRERIVGRVALEDVYDPTTGEVIVKEGEEITEAAAARIEEAGIEEVEVRSVLRCKAKHGVCAKCYGRNLATGRMVEIGEAVGVIAAQSIGEPGTQLTLRTFHTGGAAERIAEIAKHIAPFDAVVKFENLETAKRPSGEVVSLSKKGCMILEEIGGSNRVRRFNVPYGSVLLVSNGQEVKKGETLCEWEPYSLPILAKKGGMVVFVDLIEGITLRETVEEGKIERVVMMDRHKRHFPKIVIVDPETGEVREEIHLVKDARLAVHEEEIVQPGALIARVPREVGKTRDITGGLPRVEELFEARSPSDKAIVSEIDGIVKIEGPERGYYRIKVIPEVGETKEYLVPYGRYLLVGDGERIQAGEPLTTGPIDPHDILRIKGKDYVQEFLLDQIQEVYRLSGVKIDDKHIEVIVHQMMRKVRIEDSGDTKLVEGEIVDAYKVEEENEKVQKRGGKPAQYRPILLGITRSSLTTDSFIAAASFQETTKVLAQAAISGAYDELRGLKENVIIGSLVPSGTGLRKYRDLEVKVEEVVEEKVAVPEKAAASAQAAVADGGGKSSKE